MRLICIAAPVYREGNSFEPGGSLSSSQSQIIKDKKYRAAVNPPRKQYSYRLLLWNGVQPLAAFICHRTDIGFTNLIQIRVKTLHLGGEKSFMFGIGIGTSDDVKTGNIMSRYHSCVVRTELMMQSQSLEILVDLVNPLSYYRQGSCNLFRHKVPQWPSDGACHIDLFPSFRYNGKVTIDLSDLFRLPGRDPLLSLLQGHVKYLILVRIRKVYKIFKLLNYVRHIVVT